MTARASTAITFISGNQGKVNELKEVIPNLVAVDIDLPEIQSTDSEVVITAKLKEARKHIPDGAIAVEDTALHLDCLNGFPGALIKMLMQSVGCTGVYKLCTGLDETSALAKTVIGYSPSSQEAAMFFSDTMKGRIVAPAGDSGFGWDPIFQPEGYDMTLAQMVPADLEQIKMRRKVAMKLSNFLA